MRPEFYEAILDRLQREYQLGIDRTEHSAITEFYEGQLPAFKLIMSAQDEQGPAVLMMSFHIETGIPAAIQWFARVRSLDPNLHIGPSYLKDAEGVSYVGEDAEIMRMYMIEQDVLAAFIASAKDESEITELPTTKPSPLKQFSDYRQAMSAFQRMQKKKGDVSH